MWWGQPVGTPASPADEGLTTSRPVDTLAVTYATPASDRSRRPADDETDPQSGGRPTGAATIVDDLECTSPTSWTHRCRSRAGADLAAPRTVMTGDGPAGPVEARHAVRAATSKGPWRDTFRTVDPLSRGRPGPVSPTRSGRCHGTVVPDSLMTVSTAPPDSGTRPTAADAIGVLAVTVPRSRALVVEVEARHAGLGGLSSRSRTDDESTLVATLPLRPTLREQNRPWLDGPGRRRAASNDPAPPALNVQPRTCQPGLVSGDTHQCKEFFHG